MRTLIVSKRLLKYLYNSRDTGWIKQKYPSTEYWFSSYAYIKGKKELYDSAKEERKVRPFEKYYLDHFEQKNIKSKWAPIVHGANRFNRHTGIEDEIGYNY